MKSGGVLLAAAAIFLATPVWAQTLQNEVSVFGSWEDQREPVDIESTAVFARYGRFMTPNFVATLGLQRTRLETAGIDSKTWALTVGAKYYINAPRRQAIAPFVDANIGVASTDNGQDDSTDLTWDIGGGVSWFFTEATSFDAGLRLFWTETDVQTKGTRFFVGITTRF